MTKFRPRCTNFSPPQDLVQPRLNASVSGFFALGVEFEARRNTLIEEFSARRQEIINEVFGPDPVSLTAFPISVDGRQPPSFASHLRTANIFDEDASPSKIVNATSKLLLSVCPGDQPSPENVDRYLQLPQPILAFFLDKPALSPIPLPVIGRRSMIGMLYTNRPKG